MPDLTKLTALPTADWDPELADVISAMNNRPLNVHKLIANNPALLKAWWPLRQYIVSGGSLGTRNAEVVILRTAMHMRNTYEWASHVERGLAAGLAADDIDKIGARESSGLADKDALLVAAVDELVAHQRLRAASLAALAVHFRQDQLVDLIAIHSTYTMLGYLLNTWPVELDEHVSSALPEDSLRRW